MRRTRAQKRKILADPKFRNYQVAKMVNTIMGGGKKSVAETIVYRAFDILGEKTGQPPIDVFRKALDNF